MTKQHSDEFYIQYSKFLKMLKRLEPNIEIIIDEFNGIEKIENFQDYTFRKSNNISGLQLTDLTIDPYNSEILDYQITTNRYDFSFIYQNIENIMIKCNGSIQL